MSLLNITKCNFFETGTYNPQFRRPYLTQCDATTLTQLNEATRGGTNISAPALASVAGNIIKPRTEIEKMLDIANGWNERRCRFIIEIESGHTRGGVRVRKVLTGWTDKYDISHGGLIDPDMMLFINGYVTLRDVVRHGPRGAETVTSVIDNDQFLYSPPGSGQEYGNWGGKQFEHSMRPEDVYNHLRAAEAINTWGVEGTKIVDHSASFASGVKRSSRKNAAPTQFLRKMLQGNIEARDRAEEEDAADMSDVHRLATGIVSENLFGSDDVLTTINRFTAYVENGYMTYGALCELAPQLDSNIAVVHTYGGIHKRHNQAFAANSESWKSSTMETMVATSLINSVPSLMLDLLINRLEFIVSNDTQDGRPIITIPNEINVCSIVEGLDLVSYVERFKARFLMDILPGITQNNQILLNARILCDTLAETELSISVNGDTMVEYVSPTFCDSVLTPIVTGEAKLLDTLARDFSNINSNLGAFELQSQAQQSPIITRGNGLWT